MVILVCFSTYGIAWAQDSCHSLHCTTWEQESAGGAAASDTVVAMKKKSWIDKLLDYFNDANKEKINKKFDFSIIGGPHYSTDTKLGLGLVAAGLYRTSAADSLMQPSNVSLYGDVSSVGFYLLGVRGSHIMPEARQRIDYKVYFYSFPSKFWGIGYDNTLGRADCGLARAYLR